MNALARLMPVFVKRAAMTPATEACNLAHSRELLSRAICNVYSCSSTGSLCRIVAARATLRARAIRCKRLAASWSRSDVGSIILVGAGRCQDDARPSRGCHTRVPREGVLSTAPAEDFRRCAAGGSEGGRRGRADLPAAAAAARKREGQARHPCPALAGLGHWVDQGWWVDVDTVLTHTGLTLIPGAVDTC